MTITYGEGDLGQIYSSDNSFRYQLTWTDMLWSARMLVGEEGENSRTVLYAAVLWSMAQRYFITRRRYATFTEFIQAYSQPINQKWRADGDFCRIGGVHPNRRNQSPQNYHGRPECSPEKLARRERISTLEWNAISPNVRRALLDWARGRINNPIPKATDFAAPSVARRNIGDNGFRLVWDERGRLEDSTESHGNAFYSIAASRRWPDNYILIVYGENISRDSNIEEVGRESETNTIRRQQRRAEEPENELFERIETITSNRQSPPNTQLNYSTLSGSTEDPQSFEILTEDQEFSLIKTNYIRFYRQIQGLKNATTLDMSRTLPVLMITTQDREGEIVNLNELIFSKSSFHNYFEDAGEIDQIEFPDRPLASIVGMTVKVETPSVGGPTGITVGNLKIKVHNPSLVKEEHPSGKFILYMMKQGFYMRIRYGVEPLNDEDTFQTKEEDFFVAQHNISINEDKTYDLDLTILPATQKLFNQIHIGESIPFSDLQASGEALTEDDLRRTLQNITGPNTTQEEIDEMSRRLSNLRRQFNAGRASPGYRLTQVENEQGEITLGSVLHGAISQSRILENDGVQPIPVENMVDALRTIQSILLTRRIQSILEEDAWQDTTKSVPRVVVNIGPLIYKLVYPEMVSVARYVSQNNLKIGEEFSSDGIREYAENQSTPRRTRVKLIFGNFNSRAGQWANRPISQFPINADSIFQHLRAEREVGQFSSTINNFINRINSIANEPANFVIERQQGQQGEPEYIIERPQIKYLFYPHPEDDTSWIMYVYDNKVPLVRFREMLRILRNERATITKEQIMQKLEELDIPWLEIGENNSIIKNMTARTVADDLLLTHNMIAANQQAITVREMDGALRIPAGISREFMAGAQINPQNVIRSTTLIMPIEVTLTTYMMVTAFLFAPIYIFFPTKEFSELYLPYVVEHEVRDGMAQTRLTLQINLAGGYSNTSS